MLTFEQIKSMVDELAEQIRADSARAQRNAIQMKQEINSVHLIQPLWGKDAF